MNLKKRMKNLSRRDKAIVGFWIVLIASLTFYSLRVPRTELEENCAEFTRKNGCYMEEDEMREMESGRRLYELIDGLSYNSPKEVCGCVTYNITDL